MLRPLRLISRSKNLKAASVQNMCNMCQKRQAILICVNIGIQEIQVAEWEVVVKTILAAIPELRNLLVRAPVGEKLFSGSTHRLPGLQFPLLLDLRLAMASVLKETATLQDNFPQARLEIDVSGWRWEISRALTTAVKTMGPNLRFGWWHRDTILDSTSLGA